MPWDSVIRCNNTGTTHSALSSRTELLLPIGGVINNWKRRSLEWIFNSMDLEVFVCLLIFTLRTLSNPKSACSRIE